MASEEMIDLSADRENTASADKKRKGKNFSTDEECQLARSFLHISQDPTVGNGQKNQAFWERISVHFNCNRPTDCAERPARSLETKWGVIKHDVAKFAGVFAQVVNLDESGTTEKEQIEKALELYKVKHPKNTSFCFMSVWLIVKDIPRWEQPRDERRTPSMKLKRKVMAQDTELPTESLEIQILGDNGKKRPPGNKAAKEDQKLSKQRESAVRAQAKATFDLVDITKKKLELMEDQNMQAIFSVRDSDLDSTEAHEFFALRRKEMLLKLKSRLNFEANNPAETPSTVSHTDEEFNPVEEDIDITI